MCRSHTPPSYHLLTPFNYSHVLFYFLPDHDDILGSKSSEGISDFIDALDASSDSNPERFSGWRIGPLGVRFNGQKRPLCFFPFFLFFSRRGRAGEQKGSIGEAGPLIFSRWLGARARTRDKAVSPLTGASSNYGWLPAKSNPCNVHVYTQKHSFSCVRSGETRKREREKTKRRKRKKGTDDRGWLKWINDRRTREKYAVETEGLDIVTSTFSR